MNLAVRAQEDIVCSDSPRAYEADWDERLRAAVTSGNVRIDELLAFAKGAPHAGARRRDLATALERSEDLTRRRIAKVPEPQATALWDATWQLRRDVMEACDRCERAEGQARWASDE